MTDEQDRAESLDDDVIADEEDPIPGDAAAERDPLFGPDDDRFAEIAALDEDYPPDRPLGVEDPGRFEIEDDLATREARGHPDDES